MEYDKICVGLFGTCGNSKWRESFIETYNLNNIRFFNPDAGDDWHPGMIEDENHHLMEDQIILFPVLAETTGFGSLGEIGFSVSNSIRNITKSSSQYLIVMIDDDCTDIKATEDERKHSIKTRKLVKSKMLKVTHPNIIVVKDMEDMLMASLDVVDSIYMLSTAHIVYNIAG